MKPSSRSRLLLVGLASALPLLAQAQGASEPPGGIEFGLLSTGEEAEALAVGSGEGASTAIVALKQVLVGNSVVQQGIHGLTEIRDSFNGNAGIFGVNQDAGNFNNQANVVAFVMGRGDPIGQVLSVSIDVEKHDNVVVTNGSTHQERIVGSFNGSTGIVGVNQSAGSANNQVNAVAVGVGVMLGTEATVLHSTDLETLTTEDEPTEDPRPLRPGIVDSFQGYRGIAQVSQASGNQNVVRNVVSVSIVGAGGAQP
jgi:hypothetical protein